ncbi:MAG: CxxxxCH/CxxCH domain-containing protein [Myxococcota bacterium]|nr:CxxxxCH/CxxCH domain-containing protein [Myxococcota bacterium]
MTFLAVAATAGCRVGGPSRSSDAYDGPVESCAVGCHGDRASPAPPLGLAGETATTEPAVGAHRIHLATSDWRGRVACEDCHRVPGDVGDPLHVDLERPAELTWSDLANDRGALSPEYVQGADPASRACSGVYCHGATLDGGSNTTPLWTLVDGTQAACGTCHGLPPPAPHPPAASGCGCHRNVTPTLGFRDPALHIDGDVDVDF